MFTTWPFSVREFCQTIEECNMLRSFPFGDWFLTVSLGYELLFLTDGSFLFWKRAHYVVAVVDLLDARSLLLPTRKVVVSRQRVPPLNLQFQFRRLRVLKWKLGPCSRTSCGLWVPSNKSIARQSGHVLYLRSLRLLAGLLLGSGIVFISLNQHQSTDRTYSYHEYQQTLL